jgi:hypothetical protein
MRFIATGSPLGKCTSQDQISIELHLKLFVDVYFADIRTSILMDAMQCTRGISLVPEKVGDVLNE